MIKYKVTLDDMDSDELDELMRVIREHWGGHKADAVTITLSDA